MSEEKPAVCELCGEPMPPGEEMFKFHGYSGPCPKPRKAAVEPRGDGVSLIAAERKRQITEEGWDAGHDDEHDEGQLATAAACYAAPQPIYFCRMRPATGAEIPFGFGETAETRRNDRTKWIADTSAVYDAWPWDAEWDKRPKHDRKRQLVIAGALIAAEIDRLIRAETLAEKGSAKEERP